MKNYICINGKKVKLTSDQIVEMKKSLGIAEVKLSDIPVGETFKIGEYEWIVLDQFGDTTAVILKGLLYDNKAFGKKNNYKNSYVDDMCNDFGNKIAELIGDDNLIDHTVDLTSDDGLRDYGSVNRKMSLLTANQYRLNVEILDKYKPDAWWWLSTAFSTPTHNGSSFVKCVSPVGDIYISDYYDCVGVRPFCILKSNIFVSK